MCGEKETNIDWSDKVILIVEDNQLNFKLLEKILEKTGVKILHAECGNDAIKICRETSSINLILMDIQMPGIDGYETTGIIKDIRPSLPVIAQTAYTLGENSQNARKAGFEDFIPKPINQKHLLETIGRYI